MTLQRLVDQLLQKAHDELDIEYGPNRQTNHLVHHLLILDDFGGLFILFTNTLWIVNETDGRLERCDLYHRKHLDPRQPTSVIITVDNWPDYLGKAG